MSAGLVLLLTSAVALANGQTTHVWISRTAVTRLPAGDLRDLLERPDLEPMLVHGTMFPDGGYPLGHPYGEAAHWEPFQTRYLEWIRDRWSPPFDGEAAPHVAFLMGLGSHGLADQTFDAFYLDRSQLYDGDLGWADGASMDEATDFKWAQLTTGQEVPERWLPDEAFEALYAEAGIEVDAGTFHEGQDLLELAIGAVRVSAAAGGDLSHYEAAFPWAMSHLQDDALPGIPDYEAEVVAAYWTELWDRLHARSGTDLVDRTWPVDGGYGLGTDATSPDARISVIFRQGLLQDDLAADSFTVATASGTPLPVDAWLYYRDNSHIVHLVPQADWPEDTWLDVTVRAGLVTRTGAILAEDLTFSVSTAPIPADADAPDDPDDSDDTTSPGADPDADAPKTRCGHAPRTPTGWMALLVFVVAGVLPAWRRRTVPRGGTP